MISMFRPEESRIILTSLYGPMWVGIDTLVKRVHSRLTREK